MKRYTSIDPSAIEHATEEQVRHQKFIQALDVVKLYCKREGYYLQISKTPPASESVSPVAKEKEKVSVVSTVPDLKAPQPHRQIQQEVYEEAMASLEKQRCPFTLDMFYEFSRSHPQLKQITREGVKSAIKRAIQREYLQRFNGERGLFMIKPKQGHGSVPTVVRPANAAEPSDASPSTSEAMVA